MGAVMANRLKMVQVQTILALHGGGWSQRRIARQLGVDRETVARCVRLAAANPAQVPTGSDDSAVVGDDSHPAGPPFVRCSPTESTDVCGETADSKPAKLPTGSERLIGAGAEVPESPSVSRVAETAAVRRRSDCDPWRAVIEANVALGLSAKRIHQDLLSERHATVGYDSVRRFIQQLGRARPLPMRRLECAGEEVQVDFGTGAPLVLPDGKKRKTAVFRLVLSHSRKGYREAVFQQTTDEFLRCLENAFWYFGGVAQTTVIDNLRAAVAHPDWFDPELVPKLQAFARHYGTVVLPTKPYTPRHKGKIERGIGYVKGNALKARTFGSLEEQNQFLAEWATAMVAARGIEGTRVLLGLRALTKKHSCDAREKACEIALSHGEFRLRILRKLLDRQAAKQLPLPWLEEHPLIRPLSDYGRVVSDAWQRGGARADQHRANPNDSRGAESVPHPSAEGGFPRDHQTESISSEQQHPGAEGHRQGAAENSPSGPESPLSGCASAEPDSVSPGGVIVDTATVPVPFALECSHE